MVNDDRSNEDAIRDRINHLMSIVVDIDRHAKAAMQPYIEQIAHLQALLPPPPILVAVQLLPPGVQEELRASADTPEIKRALGLE